MVLYTYFLATFLFPLSLGLIVIYSLCPKNKIPLFFAIGISYGLGMGMIAYSMFLMSLVGIPYHRRSIILFLILLCLPLLIRMFRYNHFNDCSRDSLFKKQESSLNLLGILFLWFILFNIYYVFWRCTNVPVMSFDAFSTHVYKGKMIFYDKSLALMSQSPHPAYPLLVPFLESWVCFNLLYWDDQVIKIIFANTFMSYLIIQYNFLRYYTNKFWSLAGCFLVVSAHFFTLHATVAYNDFYIMYYNCTTIMLLILWQKERNFVYLFLAALFAGFTTFTKIEGTFYLAIYCLLLILTLVKDEKHIGKIKYFLVFFLPSFFMWALFYLYRVLPYALKETHVEQGVSYITRIYHILGAIVKNLFFTGNWNLLWVIFVLSLFPIKKIKKRSELQFLLSSVFLFFLTIFLLGVLTSTYHWMTSKINITMSRLILHFFPLITLVIILSHCPEES